MYSDVAVICVAHTTQYTHNSTFWIVKIKCDSSRVPCPLTTNIEINSKQIMWQPHAHLLAHLMHRMMNIIFNVGQFQWTLARTHHINATKRALTMCEPHILQNENHWNWLRRSKRDPSPMDESSIIMNPIHNCVRYVRCACFKAECKGHRPS